MRTAEQYKIYEAVLEGTSAGNPFKEVWLKAVFTNETDYVTVNGFYDGNGVYKVRFMPRTVGVWTGVTESNDPQLSGIKIAFECIPASEGNHGRVLRMDEVRPQSEGTKEDRFHFAYEDGTRFQPFGTTCYAWINQSEEVQEQTLKTLEENAFNKIRMCIFPKHYTYNFNDPDMYAFEGDAENGFDFTRFNTKFWNHLEKRIAQLDELGIEADIILLHPYDPLGICKNGL